MSPKPYQYVICCVECGTAKWARALDQMVRGSERVSYHTMMRHCDGILTWAKAHGYEYDVRKGLTLRHDPHVTYRRSTFHDWPCYYLVWSGIEFIWLRGADWCRNWGYGELRPFRPRSSRPSIARVRLG